MDETSFDWDDLRLFLAVARHGGLAAAADATGKSPPTLGRRMLSLERQVGQDLFRRLPKGYELTPAGEELMAKLDPVETGIMRLSGEAAPQQSVVKVSAGAWMTHVLCLQARTIIGADKDVSLRFIAADQVLDIARREAVIGIRNHRPEQVGLACRRIGRVQFAVYAINSGVTAWAQVMGPTPSARWVARTSEGEPKIQVTEPRNALDLALSGAAKAVLPTFVGDRQAGLQRVTPPIAALQHEQWLVTHHEDRFLPEVRRTIDRLYAVLKALHD